MNLGRDAALEAARKVAVVHDIVIRTGAMTTRPRAAAETPFRRESKQSSWF
jgi:hypothetical protein